MSKSVGELEIGVGQAKEDIFSLEKEVKRLERIIEILTSRVEDLEDAQ